MENLHITGVDYEPLIISKNPSTGCFRYIGNATTVTLNPEKFLALVEFHAPWTGKKTWATKNLILP